MSSAENDDEHGEAPRQHSSEEWLARGREPRPAEPTAAMRPAPPSRRFTWGVRGGIVLAAVFYGVLGAWSRHDAAEEPRSRGCSTRCCSRSRASWPRWH